VEQIRLEVVRPQSLARPVPALNSADQLRRRIDGIAVMHGCKRRGGTPRRAPALHLNALQAIPACSGIARGRS